MIIRLIGQKAQTLFENFFEFSPDAIVVTDGNGRMTKVNSQVERVFGYTRAELLGLPVETLMPKRFRAAHPDHRASYTAHPSVRPMGAGLELYGGRKDGAEFPVDITLSPVGTADGPIFLSVIRDVSEKKRAEEALRQAQAELAHVTRVMTLGELMASISHEVNQPIAAVVTNGQVCLRLLALETPRPDEMRAAVERIVRDANRASEVIQRIRALAKRSEPQMVSLDINDVIREAILLVQREVLSHGVSLRTELASALPPVLGDRVQLQQVVINLLINGVEAMAPITDRPREIVIRSEQDEGGQVHVAVQDSGIGIDSENAERLFSAFFTTKPSGMGMGLSISRSIIRAHGGRLWVSPNPDHGAAFQFTVPINA